MLYGLGSQSVFEGYGVEPLLNLCVSRYRAGGRTRTAAGGRKATFAGIRGKWMVSALTRRAVSTAFLRSPPVCLQHRGLSTGSVGSFIERFQ
jgi:hypothetical protein